MYMNDGNKTKINLRNKSVFITGVAGFIGSNLEKDCSPRWRVSRLWVWTT